MQPSPKSASVTAPTLILASRANESVPFKSSEQLAECFAGSVEFIALDDVGHNEIRGMDMVKEKIMRFLT